MARLPASAAGSADLLSGVERGVRGEDRSGPERTGAGRRLRDAFKVDADFARRYPVRQAGGRSWSCGFRPRSWRTSTLIWPVRSALSASTTLPAARLPHSDQGNGAATRSTHRHSRGPDRRPARPPTSLDSRYQLRALLPQRQRQITSGGAGPPSRRRGDQRELPNVLTCRRLGARPRCVGSSHAR